MSSVRACRGGYNSISPLIDKFPNWHEEEKKDFLKCLRNSCSITSSSLPLVFFSFFRVPPPPPPLHEFAFAAHHSDKQHNYCSRLKEKSNAYFETQSAGSGIFLEPPVESELHEN